MKKYILFIICCIVLCTSCAKKIIVEQEKNKNIYIEVINEKSKKIDRIEFSKSDVAKVKNILLNKKSDIDSGFVFAEGKYRIVLENDDGTINLYPYCGDISIIRVRDKSEEYVELTDKEMEQLEDILDEYIDIDNVRGIWEWSKYSENE